MNDIDTSFAKLLGREPSSSERQSLYHVRDALGIRNNDALWLIIMSLQYYQSQYEKIPQEISSSVQNILKKFDCSSQNTIISDIRRNLEQDLTATKTALEKASQEARNTAYYITSSGLRATLMHCAFLLAASLVIIVVSYFAIRFINSSKLEEIDSLSSKIVTMEKKAEELRTKYSEAQFRTCGNEKRPCIRIDEQAGRFWDDDKVYMIVYGY
jgi:predicted negative regulator of RcsB-dependent stress response